LRHHRGFGFVQLGAGAEQKHHQDEDWAAKGPARGVRTYHGNRCNVAGSGVSGLMQSGFWIFILEGLLVLGLAIFIVWWTWPKQKK
jgi:hypothetical protein